MPKIVWLNGKVMPLESAVTSVADHAHLYGDGMFEGIRIYGRKVFKLDPHLERLFHGANYMGFEQMPSYEYARQTILEVCRLADIDNGYIRLNLTRGTGLGLDPAHIDRKPNLMIMISTLNLFSGDMHDKGLDVVTSPFRVSTSSGIDPRLKCIGGYAANIMAKMEANKAGAGEALMLNTEGFIAECTGDNFFLIRNNVVHTPHPSCGILRGVTRDTIIEIAKREGYEVHEDRITPFEVFTGDEAFLTGTAAEVIPMVTLDGRKIGTGVPGPITKRLIDLFHKETQDATEFDLAEAVLREPVPA